MEKNEIRHAGVKGMRWGIRRFQYKNGTLTPAGRKRYLKETGNSSETKPKTKTSKNGTSESTKSEQVKTDTAYSTARKSVKDMSDTELNAAINRLRNEQTYNQLYTQLNPPKVNKGKEFLTTMWDKAITPALAEAGKKVMSDFITNQAEKALGLKKGEAKDVVSELRKEFDTLKLKQDIENLKNPKKDPYEELKRNAEVARLESEMATNRKKTQQAEDWWKQREENAKKESVNKWKEENQKAWDDAHKRADEKSQEAAKKAREDYDKKEASRAEKQQAKEAKRDAESRKETEKIIKNLDKVANAARQRAEEYKTKNKNASPGEVIGTSKYELIVSSPSVIGGKSFINDMIDMEK